jgi:(2R)-ethylmalonyl-CoA mutase
MKAAGLGHIPVIVGGIIPPEDAEQLRAEGVAAIYTPKDFAINKIIGDIVGQVERNFLLEHVTAEASVRETPITAANP